MVVTAKCDVYSFGVLAIEIMMGKHPGDLLSALNSSSAQDIMLNDLLDPRLSHQTMRLVEQEDIIRILLLGFACVRLDPKARPTMLSVSQELVARKPYS